MKARVYVVALKGLSAIVCQEWTNITTFFSLNTREHLHEHYVETILYQRIKVDMTLLSRSECAH